MRDCYSYETLGVKCDSPIYRLHCPWYKGVVLQVVLHTNLLHVACFLNHCSMMALCFPMLINRFSLNDMNNWRCYSWQDNVGHGLLNTPNSWSFTFLDLLRKQTRSYHVFHQIAKMSALIKWCVHALSGIHDVKFGPAMPGHH